MVKNDGSVEIQESSSLQAGHNSSNAASGVLDSNGRLEDETEPPDTGRSTPSIINDTATLQTSGIARSSRSSSQSSKDHHHDLDIKDNSRHVTVTVLEQTASIRHGISATEADVATKSYSLTVEQCIAALKTNANAGLDDAEAKLRLEANGPNTVQEAKAVSTWTILFRQVANALTVILLAAMALSFGVRDWIEGGVVCAVIAVNVTIGFVQEYKAEHALASLRSLSSPSAVLVRSLETKEVVAKDIVVGDIVLFKVGDLLPADLRIISSTNLEIEEAPLTGESIPVIKTIEAIRSDEASLSPGDCTNMAFAGTTVTKGRGRGVVIATGMNTQMGCIARQLDRRGEKKQANAALPFHRRVWEPIARFLGLRDGTPLQRKLAKFALVLLGLAIICAIIVFSVAKFHLTDDVVLYAIALGIGVLPESLIAVLTITFSVGAKRMAQSNVIVRKLDALEALGGISDIFSDKTGTLTHGKMVVNKVWLAQGEETWNVAQGGASVLEPIGQVAKDVQDADDEKVQHSDSLLQLGVAASLCNIAEVYRNEAGEWQSRGDPTEVALQVFALKLGMDRLNILNSEYTLEQEHPFDSMLKRMTMMYASKDQPTERTLFMKGAPERVLDCCSRMQISSGENAILDEPARALIMNQMETLASQGLRVLAFARRRLVLDDDDTISLKGNGGLVQTNKQLTRIEAEQHFDFIGLCGLHDPPRAETLHSVRTCQGGHIVVHMLTGDHISTARAIARQVGILDGTEPPSAVMSASQFDNLTDEEVDNLPMLPLVIARCSPTTKVRMVSAGERRKRYLLMCGDGINDAPALLHAPIGIAMGSGTDVAKDSAQLILQDDKFDNIAKAVKEGRTVFKNIQRFMIALLVLNVAEVLLLLVGLAIRDVEQESIFPISPIGILVLNLVAGLPAIGLGFEAAEEDVMTKPPHDLKAGVLSRQVLFDLFVYGFTMGWTCLVVFIAMIYGIGDGLIGLDCNAIGPDCGGVFEARSATFATLFLQGLIITWHLISIEDTLFRRKTIHRLRKNPFLFWSVIFGLACIPLCVHTPFWATDVFRQSSLSGAGWGIAIAANVVFCGTVELWKYFARRGAWPWLTRVTGGTPSTKRESKEKSEIV